MDASRRGGMLGGQCRGCSGRFLVIERTSYKFLNSDGAMALMYGDHEGSYYACRHLVAGHASSAGARKQLVHDCATAALAWAPGGVLPRSAFHSYVQCIRQ